MGIKDDILERLPLFTKICADYSVKYLYVFGSSLTNYPDPENSDIDLLVEIDDDDPVGRGEKLLGLWDTLEDFFKRKVDLLTWPSIRNPVLRENIDKTKTLIYDGEGEKVFI